MKAVVLITEGVWEAAVDAARDAVPTDASIELLHVDTGDAEHVLEGAFSGLMGRGRRSGASAALAQDLDQATAQLLDAAAHRLGRPCEKRALKGRPERVAVAAVEGADLLVMSRDGDFSRLGPKSIGHISRFIIDHVPCQLLLVWPGSVPPVSSIPPPPPPGHKPPHERP